MIDTAFICIEHIYKGNYDQTNAMGCLSVAYSKHLMPRQIFIVEANLKMHSMHINSGRHERSFIHLPFGFDHDLSQLQVPARPNYTEVSQPVDLFEFATDLRPIPRPCHQQS